MVIDGGESCISQILVDLDLCCKGYLCSFTSYLSRFMVGLLLGVFFGGEDVFSHMPLNAIAYLLRICTGSVTHHSAFLILM